MKSSASASVVTLQVIRTLGVAASLPYPAALAQESKHPKCWAALLASIVLLLPANLLPISVIYVNGGRQEDTILSGIMSLANSNVGVAAIVFIASILVPFTKVIVMFTLLISIHFNCEQGLRTRIKLLRMVLDWPLVDAGSLCYRFNHVAD